MRIKSFIAAGLLATAAVAGVSTAATASAATGYYYGTYATYAACASDGASPRTGGSLSRWRGLAGQGRQVRSEDSHHASRHQAKPFPIHLRISVKWCGLQSPCLATLRRA